MARWSSNQWVCVLVGMGGLVLGLALPFAPVVAEQTVTIWPAPRHAVVSSTALFVPYRPAELTAVVPCAVIRAATDRAAPVTVLATGPDGQGLVLRTDPTGTHLRLDHRTVALNAISADATTDCQVTVTAGPRGSTVTNPDGRSVDFPGDPVPEVFAFHTDLDPAQAAGMTVQARAASPFATSPTGLKAVLNAAQVLAVSVAVGLLVLAGRRTRAPPPATEVKEQLSRPGRRWPAIGVDAAVIAVLGGWAVIGPLAVDDGWAATIARNVAATGSAGNYYRWWNAAETPFALEQQLLAPFTEVSLAPLWLRVPSTLLAIAVWFVLTRGVLAAALPAIAATTRIRLLAAVCLLAAWLPFNLGARPESYVALGVTSVLALLWRARGPAALGWAALVTGLTLAISPTAVVLAAPILIFAPRIVAILRATARGRAELLGLVLLLGCVGSVGLSVIFTDQTWDGLITATDWHTVFGPTLPWYREAQRYQYLLGGDQQGSVAKRVPVLLTIAMLPIVAVTVARRPERDDGERGAARLAAMVILALLLMALVPSKWSFHLGA
ncbi:MAG: arabinosyltransferase domain-containing protein, partial [Actinomycetota bacterium]|nr:arabinosyltransferase domain-containing protein [Actinomycetota bacterium]